MADLLPPMLPPESPITPVQPQEVSPTDKGAKLLRALLGCGALGLVGAGIYAYLSVAGVVHVGLARIILSLTWLIAVVAVAVSEIVWGAGTKHRVSICIASGLTLGVVFVCLDHWAVKHRPEAPKFPSSTEIAGEVWKEKPPESKSLEQESKPITTLPRPSAAPAMPVLLVPEISVSTSNGLTLSDFPNRVISADMMHFLHRHSLVVKNTNTIDLDNVVIRFQLPEPVAGGAIVEERPAGVEITWHACRVSASLAGDGASAAPLAGGGTSITTGATAGSAAFLTYSAVEVCSATMDNDTLSPTGIYQLQIARLPAATAIRMAFLTSDSPLGNNYMNITKHIKLEDGLPYFGDGRFQYISGNHTDTKDVFVPMQFDWKRRVISSSPSSGEHGKWKLTVIRAN